MTSKNLGDCEVTLVQGDGGQIVEAKLTDIDINPYGEDFTSQNNR